MSTNIGHSVDTTLALKLQSMLVQLYELQARFQAIEEDPNASQVLKFSAKMHFNRLKNTTNGLTDQIMGQFKTFAGVNRVAKSADALAFILDLITLIHDEDRVDFMNLAHKIYCDRVRTLMTEEEAKDYIDYATERLNFYVNRQTSGFYKEDEPQPLKIVK